MAEQIAQATGVPTSGASNASDFHPPTRNPQDGAVPTQPQTSNLQNPTSMEVLSNQNAQIIVPSSNQSGRTLSRQETQADSGMNMFAVVLIVLALIVVVGAALSPRRKKTASPTVSAPAEDVVVSPPPKRPKRSKKKSKRKRK